MRQVVCAGGRMAPLAAPPAVPRPYFASAAHLGGHPQAVGKHRHARLRHSHVEVELQPRRHRRERAAAACSRGQKGQQTPSVGTQVSSHFGSLLGLCRGTAPRAMDPVPRVIRVISQATFGPRAVGEPRESTAAGQHFQAGQPGSPSLSTAPQAGAGCALRTRLGRALVPYCLPVGAAWPATPRTHHKALGCRGIRGTRPRPLQRARVRAPGPSPTTVRRSPRPWAQKPSAVHANLASGRCNGARGAPARVCPAAGLTRARAPSRRDARATPRRARRGGVFRVNPTPGPRIWRAPVSDRSAAGAQRRTE